MARLYADEDFPFPVVHEFLALDFTHSEHVGDAVLPIERPNTSKQVGSLGLREAPCGLGVELGLNLGVVHGVSRMPAREFDFAN